MTFTAFERIKRVIINKLQANHPFFAYLSYYLKIREGERGKDLPDHAGMGVAQDGTLIFCKDFVDELNDDELTYVITHEILHLAFLHLLRLGHREREKWNISTDICINDLLSSQGFKAPKKGLFLDDKGGFTLNGKYVKNLRGLTAEEVYDKLPDLPIKYVNGFGNGQGQIPKGWDEHIQGKGSKSDKEKDKQEWSRRVSEAYTQSKMRGNLPSGLERYFEELKKSEVNWKTLLRKHLQSYMPYDQTWLRRGKKSFAIGSYFPSVLKERIEVCVMIDLSGSIGETEMKDFLSEIVGIAKAFSNQIKMRIMTHDEEVHDDYIIQNGSIEKIKKLKLHGGGGTSFDKPLKYIEDKRIKPKCLIWLSDGYGNEIKSPKYPIIWILNKNGSDHIIKDTGTVIKLRNE